MCAVSYESLLDLLAYFAGGLVSVSLVGLLLRHAYDVTMRGLPKKVLAALTADDTL